MSERLKSRKLWVSVITALVLFLNELFEFGLDEATITALVSAAVGYVLGQGVVDAAFVYSQNRAVAEVESQRIAYRAYAEVNDGPIDPS